MRIEFDNSTATVIKPSPSEDAWLFEFLSFVDQKQRFAQGRAPKRFRMYTQGDFLAETPRDANGTFATGHLPAVIREIKRLRGQPKSSPDVPTWIENGGKPEIIDNRVKAAEPEPDNADLDWLYDFQVAAVFKVCKVGRGIIKVPTAGGKTEIMVGLTRAIPVRWLFIVHRSGLMHDARDRWLRREEERIEREVNLLESIEAMHGEGHVSPESWAALEADPHVGLFGDSIDDVLPTDRIVFATFSTLYQHRFKRGGELLKWAEGICVDECHVLAADTHFVVSQIAVNAFYRVGMSGTPLDRSDDRSQIAVGALGREIYEIPAKVLIARGFMAQPIVRMVKFRDGTVHAPPPSECWQCKGEGSADDPLLGQVPCERCNGLGTLKPHNSKTYAALIIDSVKRNELITRIVRHAAKPCMVFVEKLEHGHMLKRAFEVANLDVMFVEGRLSTKRKQAAEAKLRRADLEVCIATKVFQEGINVPNLASVVRAAAGVTIVGALQQLGRGARTDGGKKKSFELWDIYDQTPKSLAAQSAKRKKAYELGGHHVDRPDSDEILGLQ